MAESSESSWNNQTTFISFSLLIGLNRQHKLQSSIMTLTSFCLVFGGTLASSFITTWDTTLAPDDFLQKGTLSNVAQDVSTPHGRLWTTALVVSALLLITSMYPFWLYRCWVPWHTYDENPVVHAVFQSKKERFVRAVWMVIPNVGFILTGCIPSLTGVSGYKLALTGVHNVCAPLSMLFCMLMETIQLAYGERAFARFFSNEPVPLWGPLTFGQRVRVVTVFVAWICGIVFVSVQAYLFLYQGNMSLVVALVSYYGEVCGLILAFAMPAISGLDYLMNQEEGTVVEEAKRMIGAHLSGKEPKKQQ